MYNSYSIAVNLKDLPTTAGVYFFHDRGGKIIYIGKAVNLKNRVSSYFQKPSQLLPKTQSLVSQISSLDFIQVQSEIEALILEANLIKKHHPYFNVRLRDDKDYLFIKVTNEQFPTIKVTRKKDLEDAKIYFGPFPDGTSVRKVLKNLRRIFPYSSCKPNSKRACFYYHLGLCPGVCIGKISAAEYRKIINRFIDFMKGQKEKVKIALCKEMTRYSKLQNYEKALQLKNQMTLIDYITQPVGKVEEYIENPNLLDDIKEKQLQDLGEILGVRKFIRRIECYDISNFYGEFTSASMVVLSNGLPDKEQYRRFRVKTVKGVNDFASLQEVLKRRFKNDWPAPDLIVIDGGKGQLSSSKQILDKLKLDIPIIGLAKREEKIFQPNESKPLKLSKDNPSLHLIQAIRDEAHRFALSYHKKLRQKSFLQR